MTQLMALRYRRAAAGAPDRAAAVGNFAIGLLKDTSLASAVAAPELSFDANTLVERTFLIT